MAAVGAVGAAALALVTAAPATVVSVLGGVVTTTGVGAPILGWMGFSAAGPVVGSLAAAAQASVGNVAAGSTFAACQTMAMSGAAMGPLLPLAVVGACGVLIHAKYR